MDEKTNRMAIAQQVLSVCWVLLSAFLLVLILYLAGQQNKHENRELIKASANRTGDQLDNLMKYLLQTANSVKIDCNHFQQCQKTLLPSLHTLLFNHPMLSGIVIRNKKQEIICGTLEGRLPSFTHDEKPPVLVGPIKLNNKEKPVFILQQRRGDYYIELYVLQQIIEQTLKTPDRLTQAIALYDTNQKKIILQIQRKKSSHSWEEPSPDAFMKLPQKTAFSPPIWLAVNLASLKNIQIILITNPTMFTHFSFVQAIFVGLLIISLSFSIHYYLRRLVCRHFSLARAIRQSIKNNQFFPVYQPIFDLSTGQYWGVEVLLRWQTGGNHILTPDVFIEEAEHSKLIIPMTVQLIKKTFKDCRDLLASNPHLHLSINLSAIHFIDQNFLDTFKKLVRKHPIPPQQIMLELTERDLLTQNNASLIQGMRALRATGFSLAVDDFGTGYASIGYLQYFPFNFLKIDQLFVQAAGTGAITETLNQSIINMAKDLDLQIIAEGVETETQLQFLQKHGVHLLQGWYFSAAMTIDQLIPFLERSSK